MINWRYYPQSSEPTALALGIVRVFQEVPDLDSSKREDPRSKVLAAIAPGLQALGFEVDDGARRKQKLSVPVLFGSNGRADKPFRPAAQHAGERFVIEVEAGRGAHGSQFLRDLIEVCLMADVTHFALAVRNLNRSAHDFDVVCHFLDTLFASDRLRLPLAGVLVIGY